MIEIVQATNHLTTEKDETYTKNCCMMNHPDIEKSFSDAAMLSLYRNCSGKISCEMETPRIVRRDGLLAVWSEIRYRCIKAGNRKLSASLFR